MTSLTYRGRFAPSPTGPLHFGSIVAAVGSFLEARTRGGEWLVRMEDLDPPRVVSGAADSILRALEACGMGWDGTVVHQSARSDGYHAALHRLRQMGLVYPCACSRRDIADSAAAGVEGPVYPGTCRGNPQPDRAVRALRIDTRRSPASAYDDALQGHVAYDLEKDYGDFVLYRADDVYAYQLAVVVDDAEQGITDVVRGADLLASTPRQIYLQQLLGLPRLRYAHLPVAANAAGEKLSKQTFAAPIDAANPLPALVAALAFLGQQPPDGLAQTTIREYWDWALKNWKLERVAGKSSAPAPALEKT